MVDASGARVQRGVTRPEARCELTYDGQRIVAVQGESIAAALWAAGVRGLRRSSVLGEARGVFCNMGICFECTVQVDGLIVRACTTIVDRSGMVITSTGPQPGGSASESNAGNRGGSDV